MSTPKRKRVLGPYKGSVSAKAIELIANGISSAKELSRQLSIPPHEIQHHLRTHIASGILSGSPRRYKITPLCRAIVFHKWDGFRQPVKGRG